MGERSYKPTSPSRRNMTAADFSELTERTRNAPEKALILGKTRSGGRNNHGRTTVRFRGGGHKRRYRVIDFRRDKLGVPATVAGIEYDPNRTCRIALLHYKDGEKRYILAPKGISVGQEVVSGDMAEPLVGNSMTLAKIPPGLPIHNVELRPGQGGKLVRSAGVQATIQAKEGSYANVLLPSGEVRRIHMQCKATIGQVGNLDHQNIKIGKAGRNRWRGIRPTVRGSAMNPVAHPMGGGEGRRAGGRHPCSPTGVLSKGGKTRSPRKESNKNIVRKRKKK